MAINYCQNLWVQYAKVSAAQQNCAGVVERTVKENTTDFLEITQSLELFESELKSMQELWQQCFVDHEGVTIFGPEYEAIVEIGNYVPQNFVKPIDRATVKQGRIVKVGLFEYAIAPQNQPKVVSLLSRLEKLEELDIQATGITDIGGLSPLKHLRHISAGRLDNLEQLSGLATIESLVLKLDKDQDVSPLAALKKLKTFNPAILDTEVDFSSLRGAFPTLEDLHIVFNCSEEQLADLLQAGPAKELIIWSAEQLGSLKPLVGNENIRKINLASCRPKNGKIDLSPILDMPNVEEVAIGHSDIVSSQPLIDLLTANPNCKVGYYGANSQDYNVNKLKSLGAEVTQ